MTPYNFGIIVQARTNSSRLPRKIVREIDGEKSFFHVLLGRLLTLKNVSTYIATSDSEADDIIEEIGRSFNIPVFRGSEHNVLNRFINCAKANSINRIIRLCSDNPFVDLSLIDVLLEEYRGEDYLSFSVNGKPSILTHYGFFTELVSLDALVQLEKENQSNCIEHVTNCIYQHPNKFNVRFIPLSISSPDIRCTLDTSVDFEVLKAIYSEWYLENPEFTYLDLIEFLESRSDLIQQMSSQIKLNEK